MTRLPYFHAILAWSVPQTGWDRSWLQGSKREPQSDRVVPCCMLLARIELSTWPHPHCLSSRQSRLARSRSQLAALGEVKEPSSVVVRVGGALAAFATSMAIRDW